MHFTYCPHCGTKAILKEIGDEGFIPYCDACRTPLWDMFTTSIICAVINEENEIALLDKKAAKAKESAAKKRAEAEAERTDEQSEER